jgi:hypothetical protein
MLNFLPLLRHRDTRPRNRWRFYYMYDALKRKIGGRRGKDEFCSCQCPCKDEILVDSQVSRSSWA